MAATRRRIVTYTDDLGIARRRDVSKRCVRIETYTKEPSSCCV